MSDNKIVKVILARGDVSYGRYSGVTRWIVKTDGTLNLLNAVEKNVATFASGMWVGVAYE